MFRRISLIIVLLLLAAPLLAQTQTAPARPEGIPKDWKLFTAGTAFSFWGPADLKEEKVQGVDSFVGKYTSPTMTITFDYGWYSGLSDDPKYKREAITLDGRDAVLAQWDGGVILYVPKVTVTEGLPSKPLNKLAMSITCAKDAAPQAILLLRNIKFPLPPPPAK